MDTDRLHRWLVEEAHATCKGVKRQGGQWVARYRLPDGEVIEGRGQTREETIADAYALAGGPRDPRFGYRLLGREPLLCFRCGGKLFERCGGIEDAAEYELRRTDDGFKWRQPHAAKATETLWSKASGRVLCVGCRVGKISPAGLLVVFDLEHDGKQVEG